MDSEFVNLYIQRLLNEIAELTKYKMLIDTKVQFLENTNALLIKRVEEAEAKAERAQKRVKKEVDTSTF